MKTIIKTKNDLYNGDKCFTKGKEYTINREVKTEAGLMDIRLTNDLGQPHIIGSWWRQFKIVRHEV